MMDEVREGSIGERREGFLSASVKLNSCVHPCLAACVTLYFIYNSASQLHGSVMQ